MIINKEQLKVFFIQFAYSNLKYEHDYEEVELEQVQKVFNDNKDIDSDTTENIITAIQNHKALYNKFEDICNRYNKELSLELIKETQAILMKNLYRQEFEDANDKPGKFKKTDYTIGLFDVGVKAGEVEKKMQELCDEINTVEIKKDNVYKVTAYLHNWICAIHAFADGNGIVARFLINYLLLSYEFSPVIFGVARKEISNYISILEKFDDTQEILEMAKFIESYN
ncbi:Fic family protein [Clostridium sp. LQ25]|uniref:Fic family protein n=1 Tax=Clostridium sp. LQ25 TaxID=2992805 RepID=UPI002259A94E|nr:Fic family protein [Clostridium sp. LQ25]UZT06164.1 Fic family protein [Clostridium sp. LQ25]